MSAGLKNNASLRGLKQCNNKQELTQKPSKKGYVGVCMRTQ